MLRDSIHTVQTSNMQYAFGVQVYGEILYIEYTQSSQNSLITMKNCSVKDCNPAHDKVVVNHNNKFSN